MLDMLIDLVILLILLTAAAWAVSFSIFLVVVGIRGIKRWGEQRLDRRHVGRFTRSYRHWRIANDFVKAIEHDILGEVLKYKKSHERSGASPSTSDAYEIACFAGSRVKVFAIVLAQSSILCSQRVRYNEIISELGCGFLAKWAQKPDQSVEWELLFRSKSGARPGVLATGLEWPGSGDE